MKPIIIILVFSQLLFVKHSSETTEKFSTAEVKIINITETVKPVAVNDTFLLCITNGEKYISGNVMLNDSHNFEDGYSTFLVDFPKSGSLVFKSNGSFTFENAERNTKTVSFNYKLSKSADRENASQATVFVIMSTDNDYDGIIDLYDIDNDNDGILNIYEGDDNQDTDMDGVPDCKDIDSDNDGIPDIIEWQAEDLFIGLSEIDINKNGWDDAFEPELGGVYYEPTDTDEDGAPDYLDLDSDQDDIPDQIEGNDSNGDNIPEHTFLSFDTDFDGLDDGFDIVQGWKEKGNSFGSNAILADNNKNGIRDWRDSFIDVIPGQENTIIGNFYNFYIYPNPTSDNIHLNFPDEYIHDQIQLQVFNLIGQQIKEKKVSIYDNYLNLQDLEAGYYMVKITINRSKKFTQKIFVR